MKCKCGNEIDIKMIAKVKGTGCRILTGITSVLTAQCENCGNIFQAPVTVNNAVVKEE